jgi:hypothetical protein
MTKSFAAAKTLQLRPQGLLAAPSPKQRWRESFADPGGEAFAAIVSADVELDGSALARPVHGRHDVWTVLRTAATVYDSLVFTHDAAGEGRAYLEWTATALGMQIDGVTVLVLDGQGPFARVAVYHRPLAAVLAFSAEMARRLATGPGAGHFHQVP